MAAGKTLKTECTDRHRSLRDARNCSRLPSNFRERTNHPRRCTGTDTFPCIRNPCSRVYGAFTYAFNSDICTRACRWILVFRARNTHVSRQLSPFSIRLPRRPTLCPAPVSGPKQRLVPGTHSPPHIGARFKRNCISRRRNSAPACVTPATELRAGLSLLSLVYYSVPHLCLMFSVGGGSGENCETRLD